MKLLVWLVVMSISVGFHFPPILPRVLMLLLMVLGITSVRSLTGLCPVGLLFIVIRPQNLKKFVRNYVYYIALQPPIQKRLMLDMSVLWEFSVI